MTNQRLFKPLLEGTYRLRNRFTGKYLTTTDEGLLGTTRAYIDDTHYSEWEIRRTEAFVPTYTVVNHHSNLHLTASGLATEPESFSFELDASGIYWSIAQESGEGAGSHFLFEDSTSNLVGWSQDYSGVESAEFLNWKKYWEAEIVGRPYGRIRPRKARGEYEWQWTQASKIPMWLGASYTWYDMCVEVGEESVCPKGYASSREYYQAAGMVSENGGNNVVSENTIGMCDSPLTLERQRFQLPGLVQALKDTAGAVCASFDLQTISTLMRRGIVEECYSECLTQIQAGVDELGMTCEVDGAWADLFTAMRESLTCNLSPSTVLYLADWVMQQKCWTWPIPAPLWVPNDHGPGVTNLARADGTAVCTMQSGAEDFRSDAKIQQSGNCVEGTTCECPRTWLSGHESLSAMRLTQFSKAYSDAGAGGTSGANLFIADYSAAWAGVTSTMQRSMLIGTAVQMTIFGASLPAAILAVPFGIPFIAQTSLALFTFGRNGLSWNCDKVLGCWPAEPKRERGACRIPDATKAGGSAVWFMPPPGFFLKHRTWRVSKCSLTPCEKADIVVERVEFTKREVYNCQFLSYGDMTTDQQSKYLETLRLTLPTEYASEI